MAKKSQVTRELLCEAAMEVATQDGLLSMTLDNVAKKAGVSKGGVMYHFPSKDQLVEAVVAHFGQRMESLILERVAVDPEPRFRLARAILDCCFPPRSPAVLQDDKVDLDVAAQMEKPCRQPNPADIEKFFLAVLAVAVNNPKLIAPLREVGRKVQKLMLADPQDGFDQLIIWAAIDGLLLWQLAGLISREEPLFQQFGVALRGRLSSASSPQPRNRSSADSSGSEDGTQGIDVRGFKRSKSSPKANTPGRQAGTVRPRDPSSKQKAARKPTRSKSPDAR